MTPTCAICLGNITCQGLFDRYLVHIGDPVSILVIGFFLGAALLLAALIWGVMSYNRRNPSNQAITDEATRELYADTDTYGDKEAKLRSRTT